MSLNFIFWSTCVAGLVSFWWQSDKIKNMALSQVLQYCQQQQLQLLDQTMVLKGLGLGRNDSGILQIQRRYAFEFTSTGEERYAGLVELSGSKLRHIELAPHILPEERGRLH